MHLVERKISANIKILLIYIQFYVLTSFVLMVWHSRIATAFESTFYTQIYHTFLRIVTMLSSGNVTIVFAVFRVLIKHSL